MIILFGLTTVILAFIFIGLYALNLSEQAEPENAGIFRLLGYVNLSFSLFFTSLFIVQLITF